MVADTVVKGSRGSLWRSRWAAIGAAVAVTFGGGGLIAVQAASSAPSSLITIDPCRLIDTRAGADNVGPRATPLGNAETVTFAVHGTNGKCTIPATATGISANVTVVGPTSASFLTLFPAGGALPLASNLNFTAGQAPTPNAVTVGLGGGKVSVFNRAGSVDVIIDIVGYYDPATSGPAGPQGPKGDPGLKGDKGEQGEPAVSCVFEQTNSGLVRLVCGEDEILVQSYGDVDNDGFPERPVADFDFDCDDSDDSINPDQGDIAGDGIDSDCDGQGVDLDSDGYETPFDCDDEKAGVNPDAVEIVDGFDNNCDGVTDDVDTDGDGFLDTNDCDPSDASVNPDAPELPDGIDNNCNGVIDEGTGVDSDSDGYETPFDCDDDNSEVNPGAVETLNGVDDNCDTQIDEGLDN